MVVVARVVVAAAWKVDDAFNAPLMRSPPLTEEEAFEINPPMNVERSVTDRVDARTVAPATWSVPDADNAPATWRPAAMEDDAEEIKPDRSVARLNVWKVPEAETLPDESTKNVPRLFVLPCPTINWVF